MKEFKKGERVITPLGKGKIIDFNFFVGNDDISYKVLLDYEKKYFDFDNIKDKYVVFNFLSSELKSI